MEDQNWFRVERKSAQLWAEQTRGEGEPLGTWSHLEEAGIVGACLAGAEAMEETRPPLQTPAEAEWA